MSCRLCNIVELSSRTDTCILMTMPTDRPTTGEISVLLENHRAFLRFLERRVSDRDTAEDILQDGFTKVLARPDIAPDSEAVVPWFYRLLRNTVIDRYRRGGTAAKALELFARELERRESAPPDVEAEICACVARLLRRSNPSTPMPYSRSMSKVYL